jgi:hypothetical protein
MIALRKRPHPEELAKRASRRTHDRAAADIFSSGSEPEAFRGLPYPPMMVRRRRIGPLIKVARRNIAFSVRALDSVCRAERHHDCRHVVAGIAIRDIAAEGSAVPNLRIGNLQ